MMRLDRPPHFWEDPAKTLRFDMDSCITDSAARFTHLHFQLQNILEFLEVIFHHIQIGLLDDFILICPLPDLLLRTFIQDAPFRITSSIVSPCSCIAIIDFI